MAKLQVVESSTTFGSSQRSKNASSNRQRYNNSSAHQRCDSFRARRIKSITTAPQGFEGEGFPVRRAFAGVDLAELDPFIHLDQMGEVEYAPGEPKGTPWHPHRGFETVTYIIDGIFDHKDSNGGGGSITDGDTQWMTAGGGILHIETPPEHLVMSWRSISRLPTLGKSSCCEEVVASCIPRCTSKRCRTSNIS
jgi:hypothetical protein